MGIAHQIIEKRVKGRVKLRFPFPSIIRGFFGNDDIVDMALSKTRMCDSNKPPFLF